MVNTMLLTVKSHLFMAKYGFTSIKSVNSPELVVLYNEQLGLQKHRKTESSRKLGNDHENQEKHQITSCFIHYPLVN